MTGERRYDDREVGQILKRVAELHEREGDQADARAMTRAEIEQVVHELGISRALVARATSELAVQDVRNRPVWWLGVVLSGALLGWLGSRALWRRSSVGREEQLRRAFGEIHTRARATAARAAIL